MKLCDINRTGAVCWSPCAESTNVIACGSIAGSLEFDLSSKSKLEFFQISPTTLTAEVVGSLDVDEQFNQLTWSRPFEKGNETYKQGLLAGAKIDGRIGIWNPNNIITGEGEAEVANLDRHKASVKGLDFNPELPHFLASASEDGQVTLWDLTKGEDYNIRNNYLQRHMQISCLSWNRKRNNILCTASREGTCVVWNAEKQASMIVFENSQERRRYSSIAWNPEILTQLAVASEDDNGPVVEIWELRQAYEPVMTLRGHTKGILSLSWCPFDSNLLISSGKDGRTLIWNPVKGSCVGELPQTNSWTYGVQWAMKPSFLATSSYDKNVSIYSIQDPSMGHRPEGGETSVAPKWLQRTVGGCFGFGSKYVQISNQADEKGKQGIIQLYSVRSTGEDEEFLIRCKSLEDALSKKVYEDFCLEKAQSEDEQVWKLLSLFCRNDDAGDRRGKLLDFLGYNREEIKKALVEFEVPMKQKSEEEESEKKIEEVEEEKEQEEQEGEGEQKIKEEEKEEPQKVLEVMDDNEVDSIIQRAMIIRDFKEVVNVCLKAERYADAIIFAGQYGDKKLQQRARDAYLKTITRNTMRSVLCVMNSDLEKLVNEINVDQWRTALAILTTFSKSEKQFRGLSAELGKRLGENDLSTPALLCNIFSGNFDLACQHWLQELEETKVQRKDALVSFVEKVMIFRQTLTKFKKVDLNKSLSEKFGEFARILADFGETRSALLFLNMVESEKDSVLRHRIYYSLPDPFGSVPRPPFSKQQGGAQKPVVKKQERKVVKEQPKQQRRVQQGWMDQQQPKPAPKQHLPVKRPSGFSSGGSDSDFFQPPVPSGKARPGPIPRGGFSSTSSPSQMMHNQQTTPPMRNSPYMSPQHPPTHPQQHQPPMRQYPPSNQQQSPFGTPPMRTAPATKPPTYTSPYQPTQPTQPTQPMMRNPGPPKADFFSPPRNTKMSGLPLFSQPTGPTTAAPTNVGPPGPSSQNLLSTPPVRDTAPSPFMSGPMQDPYGPSRVDGKGLPVNTPLSFGMKEVSFPGTPIREEVPATVDVQDEEEDDNVGSGDKIRELDYEISSGCTERNRRIILDFIEIYNTVFCAQGSRHRSKKSQAKNITKGLFSFFFMLNRNKVGDKILTKYEELINFAKEKKQVKVRICFRDISKDFYKETRKYFKMTKFLIGFYLK